MNIVERKAKQIARLASATKQMDQINIATQHYFSEGTYVREIHIPKGVVVVGKVHKTRHLNMLTRGAVVVITPTKKLKLKAPATFESLEGEQKVILAVEDATWSTVHATEETDISKIEENCVVEETNEETLALLLGGLK